MFVWRNLVEELTLTVSLPCTDQILYYIKMISINWEVKNIQMKFVTRVILKAWQLAMAMTHPLISPLNKSASNE